MLEADPRLESPPPLPGRDRGRDALEELLNKALLALLVLVVVAPKSFAAATAAKSGAAAKPKDVAADINAPRPDARKLSFEVRQGTWMSVDVSPDGQTLVFDLLGDIYSVPAAGGDARALTAGPAFDSQPRFSPDGATIAFTSDRGGIENVWLMGKDGQGPRALTQEKDAYVRTPVFSPDGQYVIARKEDGKRAGIPPVELWMYHREGGEGIKLTNSDEVNNASGPAPSPDGRFLYFAARQRRFNYTPNLTDGLWQVFRYDRGTAEVLPLTEGIGGAVRPAVSPDGRTLVYVSRRDSQTALVARDLESGAEKLLVRGVTRDEMEGFAQMDVWPGYAFTPDAKALVFSNHGKLTRLELATGQAREIPFLARVEQSLAPRVAFQDRVDMGPVQARILRRPNQSPDGKWIVFDAFGRVYLQELQAGKPVGAPRRLTSDAASLPAREHAPAFSPDGSSIAYVTWSDREGGHVWKSPLAGPPQRLTRSAGHYANPTWSPSGDRLAVIRGSGLEFRGRQPEEESAFEIRWLDAGGGDTHLVTSVKPPNGHTFHPQAFWSPDGTRLLYRQPVEQKKPTDDPKNDLVSVRLDGTDKKAHLRVPAVSELVPSPDGRHVVFVSRDNVYLAPFPALKTAEPAEVSIQGGALPVWRLSDAAGGWVAWADAGKTITWGLARSFHRLPLEEAFRFAEEQRRKAEEEKRKAAAGDKQKGKQKDAAKTEKKDDDELKLPKSQEIEIALTLPRSLPQGSLVLRGARVLTLKGDAALENADVLITGNRIAAVGPAGGVRVPEGARALDAQGTTVIPGLIDSHAHLHYSGLEIFPDTKWEYAANLAYGVTSVYDPSAPSFDVFAQAEMIEAGRMLGPRVYSSGDVLYGGQQTDIWAAVDKQQDALRQVRRMQAYGARMIKVYQQPRRSQRMYFAEAARQLRMLLTAEGGGEYQTDLTMAMDGFTAFEHALPVELGQDAVELFARSGTHYTPTLLVAYGGPNAENYFYQTANPHDDPKLNRFVPHFMLDNLSRRHPWIWPDEYHFPTVAQGAAEIAKAGGNVSLGAHGQLQGLGVHWELWAMAGAGGSSARPAMTPLQALRAATVAAADKLGFAADLGTVEAGKLADLVVLEADPLADIRNTTKIRWVIKNGEVFEAETLRQIWPKEQALPGFFWQR